MGGTDTKIIFNRPIVFFDGVCSLCNGFVDFLVSADHGRLRLHIASLQGATAKERLPPEFSAQLASIVYWEEGKISTESTAVLRIWKHLGFPWTLFYVFILVPEFLRNWVYRFIAKHRYKWFGKRESCRLPTASERVYFLD